MSNHKKKSKGKPARANRSAIGPALDQERNPAPQEIKALGDLFTAGRYVEAAALAQKMTESFPRHGFGWMVLGAVLKQGGRSAEALAFMQKGVALAPNCAEAHSDLGNTFKDLGRLAEAEASYQRALALKPELAMAHYNLGNTLTDLGRLDEAAASYRRALEINPNYAKAYYNLGNTLKELGRLDEAEASYRRALEIMPDYAEAHSNLGNTLKELGRLGEAEASYRRALAIRPHYAEAHSNLGNTLKELGRLDEAEASYRRALEARPHFAEVHNNLGNALKDLGRLDEAEASYRRALAIRPHYAEAHSNLGNTLNDLGRLGEAEASYRRALEIKPGFAEALNNLALLLSAQGQSTVALQTIKQSLQIKETEEAKGIFVACVKSLRLTPDDSEIRGVMARALTEPWGRPQYLTRCGIELVKFDPHVGGCVARAVEAWPRRLTADNLFGVNGLPTLAADPLLFALLDSAPICDLAMERFLTMARRALLEDATGLTAPDAEVGKALRFYSALARQCFINEYVFCCTADEIQKVNDLREALVAALATKAQVPLLWPLAVAAYLPLGALSLGGRLLERQWPEEVAAVLVQQVCEPEEERRERRTIPRLTSIDDEVSLLVQGQYEENPYPRWIKIASCKASMAAAVGVVLRRFFPLAPFQSFGRCGNPDILIAGCGTGQQPIGTAQRFRGAQVLAVDLSISSLSYAKRKTRALGLLASIEYAQADLLKLGTLGRSFDVIESVGVLHHLADPWAGWQALLSLLRPGGVMRLGFYSAVARRNIVRIRRFIAEQGYGATGSEIRRCRQDLMALDNSANLSNTLQSADFFSTSTCRDLFFHVQEHCLTLPSIEEFLLKNNLVFLGFEIDEAVRYAYKRRFPDDLAATNLAQWWAFENNHPDTFLGMYQFWVQKRGE